MSALHGKMTFSPSVFKEKHWLPQVAKIWKSCRMLAFASSFHEATKNLNNACFNVLLHKAPIKSVGSFWIGQDI